MAQQPGCVTVQLDWANAFNAVSRQAVIDAVARRAPQLLPFVAWAYRQPSRLFVPGAPPESAPVMSQTGVRQGDPMGPLLFALALQGPLQVIAAQHPDSRPIAYADDTSLQGTPDQVVAAFRALTAEGAKIGLTARPDKCVAFSTDSAAARAVAERLGIQHASDGIVAVGTPIGTDPFVAEHAATKAASVLAALDELQQTPLSAQDKFIVLRASQQLRVAHLKRTCDWTCILAAVEKVEDKVITNAWSIVGSANADLAQALLPLSMGGLGIELTEPIVARAATISAAALAHAALQDGHAFYQPFEGPAGASIKQAWRELHQCWHKRNP